MKRFVAVALLFGCALLPSAHLNAGPLAQFRTVFGEVDVELYDQDKPITVSNFVHYVNSGSYSNMFFHRCVPGFVVQGGGFYTASFGTASEGIANVTVGPAIASEFSTGRFFSNTNGTVAMALSAFPPSYTVTDPNSATSQFFFNLANNSASLDSAAASGTFTVFGHVVGGSNILSVFNTFTGSTNATKNLLVDFSQTSLGPAFSTTPMLDNSLTFEALVYVDITLLNVQVTNKNGLSQISWNSVSNQVNFVEYTSNFPPAWNTVTNFVGTGSATNVVDPTSAGANRFYRVRVVY